MDPNVTLIGNDPIFTLIGDDTIDIDLVALLVNLWVEWFNQRIPVEQLISLCPFGSRQYIVHSINNLRLSFDDRTRTDFDNARETFPRFYAQVVQRLVEIHTRMPRQTNDVKRPVREIIEQ